LLWLSILLRLLLIRTRREGACEEVFVLQRLAGLLLRLRNLGNRFLDLRQQAALVEVELAGELSVVAQVGKEVFELVKKFLNLLPDAQSDAQQKGAGQDREFHELELEAEQQRGFLRLLAVADVEVEAAEDLLNCENQVRPESLLVEDERAVLCKLQNHLLSLAAKVLDHLERVLGLIEREVKRH